MKKLISMVIMLAFYGASAQVLGDDHKTEICHKGKDVSVANAAVPAHMAHGDSVGECEEEDDEPDTQKSKTVVMLRCEGITGEETPENNTVQVVSASSSVQSYQIVAGRDCAVTLAGLLNIGYTIGSITSGSADSGDDISLYTDYLLLGTQEIE